VKRVPCLSKEFEMARNSGSVIEFFRLPNNNVIELGTRIQT
jgi:hypothetical protein